MSFQKLDSPMFMELVSGDIAYLFELFKRHNYELRIAGGAVRDLLMQVKPHDIDFATTATPDQMKEIFEKEDASAVRIRLINTNGEKHGTITLRLNEAENYEITTLRVDKVTDGRHAEVEFTEDWQLDANRRDLTVNSIFLDADGTIIDYFNGYEDLKQRRVRFVGEPNKRVTEDYLRILRFFRFYGRICENDSEFDEASLDAIKANASGLANIAGERIWVELKQIVRGRFSDKLMRKIVETGVHKHIGFPETCQLDEFQRVFKLFEIQLDEMPSSTTMICALLSNVKEFEKLHKRIKFSNEEKRLAEFLFIYRDCLKQHNETPEDNDGKGEDSDRDRQLKIFKYILVDNVSDLKVREKLVQLLKYVGKVELIDALASWTIPVFPVNGETLTAKNVPKGPLFAKILAKTREAWKRQFELDTSEPTVNKLLKICDDCIKNKNV